MIYIFFSEYLDKQVFEILAHRRQKTQSFYAVKAMAADGLATQGVGPSAAMVLTHLSGIITVNLHNITLPLKHCELTVPRYTENTHVAQPWGRGYVTGECVLDKVWSVIYRCSYRPICWIV